MPTISVKGQSVELNTRGRDGIEFNSKKASGGSKRRSGDKATGDIGYDGAFGRDGEHGGNISIKVGKKIESIKLLTQVDVNGGKGGDGQLGGDGDRGKYGQDGDEGKAPSTEGIGGGQTTIQFGFIGTRSGIGGCAGKSGKGGRAGKSGNPCSGDSSNSEWISRISNIRSEPASAL